MRRPVGLVRERLVPAVLTAAGVTLLAAGLLHYGTAADARVADGSSSPAAPVASLPDFVVPSLPPLDGSPVPTVAPSTDPNRVATRIVIEALGIDLPIVVQPNSGYPWCNVAMYIDNPLLGQPGGGRSVYLYAHARDGMFGPLYERITLGRSGGAKSLIGMPVLVYTSDDHVYEYAITKIHPRVPADTHFLDRPFAVTTETLWLQTSTGHGGDLPKLQVEALPFFDDVASHADAHPRARPVVCG
jgi:hypothetical protein